MAEHVIEAALADSISRLALQGVATEFPNKPGHVMAGPADVRSPRELHPVFYGCFDWHSSVHSHWALVRMLRCKPDIACAAEIRSTLAARLNPADLEAEAAYLSEPHNRSFERMYGWAWALRLAAELRAWDDADAQIWARNLEPLTSVIVTLVIDYLPRLGWPDRSGVHSNTAFALAQIVDHARVAGDGELESLVVERARQYYFDDHDAPVRFEPSGEDFLSPSLAEADLMRRVCDGASFAGWLDRFWPALSAGKLGVFGSPVERVEMTDGRLSHLAGLNLSRAWAMRGVADALDPNDARRDMLLAAAAAHEAAGLASVESGRYEGEHWLGTFAAYAILGVGAAAETRFT